MSIKSQIDRLNTNVNDTFTAITEAGVSVPEGTNSDGLAGLVRDVKTKHDNEINSICSVLDEINGVVI